VMKLWLGHTRACTTPLGVSDGLAPVDPFEIADPKTVRASAVVAPEIERDLLGRARNGPRGELTLLPKAARFTETCRLAESVCAIDS
jgi:hypothetical protein